MNPSASPSQHSSSPTAGNARIFVDDAGNPLQIFVESNGIRNNRPKLIRTLRNCGANICIDVSAARIIIVDPNSEEGQFFKREWTDSGKVVLSVTWITLCLQHGRALMEKDGWGGCDKIDGTLVRRHTEGDGDALLYANSGSFGLNGTHSAHPQTQAASVPPGHLISALMQAQQPTGMDLNAPNTHTQVPQQFAPPSSQTQFPSSFNMQHQSAQPFSQNGLSQIPNMGPNMLPSFGHMVPQSQFNMNGMNPQMQLQQALMSNPEVMAAAAAFLMGGGMMGSGPFGPQWQGMQPFMQPSSQGFPMVQPPHPQQLPVSAPNPIANDVTVTGTPAVVKHEERTPPRPRRSSTPLPTFTTVNDSDSDSSPPPSRSILRQRGKKRPRDSPLRSVSPTPARRPGSPVASRRKRRDKGRTSLSFLFDDATNQALPPDGDRPHPIGIFTHKNGKPKTFFLQVQMRNRQNVIKQIKTNGGKIETDPAKADFILLDTQSGKDRDQWMKSIKSLNRFALGPTFVEACINSNGMVEEDDFLIEAKKSRRRSKRMNSPESEEGLNTGTTEVVVLHEPMSRSPSPPAISKIPSGGGRASYTVREIEYALSMAKHCVSGNPGIGIQQIGGEIAKRAPRHSAGSWANVLYDKNNREELERYRSTCWRSRKKQKASPANVLSGSEPEVEAQLTQTTESASAQPSAMAEEQLKGSSNGTSQEPANEAHSPDPHEADLKTIVGFFAAPPEGAKDDETLWNLLAGKHACRTKSSWQVFYLANQNIVDERLLREREGTLL